MLATSIAETSLTIEGVRIVVDSGYRRVPAYEPATGLTLYTDTVLRALPAQPPPRRIYIPAGNDAAVAKRLRHEGWVTVAGLEAGDDPAGEARRLNCGHRLEGETILPVT